MHNEFKNGELVIVFGPGKNDGKFYNNKFAKVILRDPYFKDYQVRFKDGTEDWISPKYLRTRYKRKKRRKKI